MSSESDSDSSLSLFPSSKRRSVLLDRVLSVAEAPYTAPGAASMPTVQHLSLHEDDSGSVVSELDTADSLSNANEPGLSRLCLCSSAELHDTCRAENSTGAFFV